MWERFVHWVRVFYLHIISRNHSNTLLLINLQKTKNCPKLNTAGKAVCFDVSFGQCRQAFVHYLMSILMHANKQVAIFIK